ncbi:hypothetical protein [Castellaniella sp.]|uniref:hypothetical protein n=1 Tax=Castellaniella sp. TaxID=1955812 RepID=UPI002AFF2D7C|nr:hypothetical protein [Castellaniella sp.]
MNMTVNNSGGVNFAAALASGDIQTIIQMVQSERVRLLDSQLVDQVKAVQSRNDQIAKLNNVLSSLNAYSSQIKGTDAQSKPADWGSNNELRKTYEVAVNDAIQDAGITDLGIQQHDGLRSAKPGEQPSHPWEAVNGVLIHGTNVINPTVTKGEVDAAITKIKGMIDAESNNQQMDMLRLQSLNNKKNESIEILTNTQKKHTDSASSIIRNI